MTDGGGSTTRSRLRLTPTPSGRTSRSSFGRASRVSLTREDIDDILESPIETDYTYSHSVAYRRSGSLDYTYPKLSRPMLNTSGWAKITSKHTYAEDDDWDRTYDRTHDRTYAYPTDQYYYPGPRFVSEPNFFVRGVNYASWLLKSILVFILTTVVYAAYKVSSWFKYLFTYLLYLVTYPIFSPVYAAKRVISNWGYLMSLVKDAAMIAWQFVTSFIWNTGYVSTNLINDLKAFFWRLLGYKVPLGRTYTEKIASSYRKGTRYTMRTEETEYITQPDEVEYVEKVGLLSRLGFYAQWIFYTALWLMTLGYVKIAPSYVSPYPAITRRSTRKAIDTRSTYTKLYSFIDSLITWIIWFVTLGPLVKLYRYFYPEMRTTSHRVSGRPRTRAAGGPAEVPVPPYERAKNKTEQIMVYILNLVSEMTNKVYNSTLNVVGETPEKRRKNLATWWWLPLLLLLLFSTYYLGRNTYADYKNSTESGAVHNPAEYIASKFPSDVHLIPETVKNTFSGASEKISDLKSGTVETLSNTKDWVSDKGSYAYYSAMKFFYSQLARFFGVLEYLWSYASWAFYKVAEGVLWVVEQVIRGVYWATESVFEGSSKFLDKIGHYIKQGFYFIINLPVRLFSAIVNFLKTPWDFLVTCAYSTGRFLSSLATSISEVLPSGASGIYDLAKNGAYKAYEGLWTLGYYIYDFLCLVGLTIWNFFGAAGSSISNTVQYIASKPLQAVAYITPNFWSGLKTIWDSILNAHYYLFYHLSTTIKNLLYATYEIFKNGILAMFGGVKDAILAVFEGVKSFVWIVWDFMSSIFNIIWMLIRFLGLTVANFLRSITFGGWEAIENASSKTYDFVKSSTWKVGEFFYGIFASVFNFFGNFGTNTWDFIKNLGSIMWNFFANFGTNTWSFFTNFGFNVGNFFNYLGASIWSGLSYVGSTIGDFFSLLWRKTLDIFALDWLESPVDFVLSKSRTFFYWLVGIPKSALTFVYEYILGPVSGWFAYVYRGISARENRTVEPTPPMPPTPGQPGRVQEPIRQPMEIQYHEADFYTDSHPLMIKLRQIVDEALQKEKVDLENRLQFVISEHVDTVKSDVDNQADRLRESYHLQLDKLQQEMSTRYNDMVEKQVAKFANVLRAEITAKLPKEEDIEKDMEIRALHAQIDALKDELANQAKGMELELETRVQNIIKRLENMQDTRWKAYTEQLETKFKPKVTPEAELWALQQDIENLKKELKAAHIQKATAKDDDTLLIDAKITAILDKLLSSERQAIKVELESIEKRLTEKTKETKVKDPNLVNLEEELEKKMESIVGSITRQMNEQNSKFLTELQELRRIYQETLSKSTQETKTTYEIHTLKRELELNEQKYLEDVRRLIREYIQKYDADKTGLPDYALESSGGSVISTRCTVPYKETSRRESIWGIPLWYSSYGPRSVIQRKSQGVNAGECWAFVGEQGYLTIKLSHRINVTAVSYEHLPKELAPQGQLKSAPKEFIIWSYQDADDLSTKYQLGRFVYDINGESLQMFTVNKHDPKGTPVIELETVSNYGSSLTCLYRFRVHGQPLEDAEAQVP